MIECDRKLRLWISAAGPTRYEKAVLAFRNLTSAYFGMLRLVFKMLKAPASPRPFFAISTTRSLPRRALSSMTESQNDLYDYTSGRWV